MKNQQITLLALHYTNEYSSGHNKFEQTFKIRENVKFVLKLWSNFYYTKRLNLPHVL